MTRDVPPQIKITGLDSGFRITLHGAKYRKILTDVRKRQDSETIAEDETVGSPDISQSQSQDVYR